MTEIEQKALTLLNEVLAERRLAIYEAPNTRHTSFFKALCRAVEQHEAFRREVSDAVEGLTKFYTASTIIGKHLSRFIIPQPVDPLVEAIATALRDGSPFDEDDSHDYKAACILYAMKARGYEFTKIGEGA